MSRSISSLELMEISPRDILRSSAMTPMTLFSKLSTHAPWSIGRVAIRIGIKTLAVNISGGDRGEMYGVLAAVLPISVVVVAIFGDVVYVIKTQFSIKQR